MDNTLVTISFDENLLFKVVYNLSNRLATTNQNAKTYIPIRNTDSDWFNYQTLLVHTYIMETISPILIGSQGIFSYKLRLKSNPETIAVTLEKAISSIFVEQWYLQQGIKLTLGATDELKHFIFRTEGAVRRKNII